MSKRPAFSSLQRWSRRALAGVLAVGLLVLGAAFYVLGGRAFMGAAPSSTDAAGPVRDLTTMTEAQTERLRTLRDEAIDCMGWAAGNSFRSRTWPEVESYVGQRGLYYDEFLQLAPPGAPRDLEEAERSANLARYRSAFMRGQRAAYNEAESTRCIERTIELSRELERLLEQVRDPRTLGSPVSPD